MWTWYEFPAGGMLGLKPIEFEGILEPGEAFVRVNGARETEETTFEAMLERSAALGHCEHALGVVHPLDFEAFASWVPSRVTTHH